LNYIHSFRSRLYFTAIVSIAIWTLLIWDYFHGGIPSHHLLANDKLPAVSNGWGAILLPLLTWFLLYRIHKWALCNHDEIAKSPRRLHRLVYRLFSAFLFGALLSAFFTFGYADICGYMVLGLFPLAIFFPIYRAECLLGFVLAMTFTFGAILPTGFGGLLCLACFLLYRYLRPGLLYIGARLLLIGPEKPNNRQ